MNFVLLLQHLFNIIKKILDSASSITINPGAAGEAAAVGKDSFYG